MRLAKIIPFRLESQRFPEKALASFLGISLLEKAIANASEISGGRTILTASEADYQRALEKLHLDSNTYEFMPSSGSCKCATDRLAEIYKSIDADLYISLPIDEGLLNPSEISRVVEEKGSDIAGSTEAVTLWCRFFRNEDALSPLSAKIVMDPDNRVLYMSRALIPANKSGKSDISTLKKNVGVFLFSRTFLECLDSNRNSETKLDIEEGLEQLRWIELGLTLRAYEINHKGFGVDIPAQLAELEERSRC